MHVRAPASRRSLLLVPAAPSCMSRAYLVNKRLNKTFVYVFGRPGSEEASMGSPYPPSPRWPAAVQSVLFQRHRARFLPAVARRYGDVFSLRVPPYADNLVV